MEMVNQKTEAAWEAAGEVDNLRDGVADAIDGLFALCEAMQEHGLTINDLASGCKLAIAEGHDRASICLLMMEKAVALSSDGVFSLKEEPQ